VFYYENFSTVCGGGKDIGRVCGAGGRKIECVKRKGEDKKGTKWEEIPRPEDDFQGGEEGIVMGAAHMGWGISDLFSRK